MLTLKKISFEVLVDAIPLARPRYSRGHVYLPKRSRDYRAILQEAARAALLTFKAEPMIGALYCRLNVYRKFNATSRNFGDWDNHAKAICDALTGIIYRDDAQIVSATVSKCTDKSTPRVVVEIGAVDFEDVTSCFEPIDGGHVGVIHMPRICQ